ncbi:hypothetical protein AQ802_15905 [Burkholderia pseudomallei]|nr:hypothetical protein X995_1470 [Burkholderia pseudomallei B03]AIV94736.1 hypothetical protein X996_1422 [Burkholderia pseudomallei A79A]AJW54093.1 hypothetical protein UQ47_14180 [Burkholderia pseudomallei]KGU73323.1 hypothetical protein X883_3201 [Burkholderia pseudomallei MSHR4304]KGY05056.1 hypothetical protein Y023_6158 [Burkholderia pseudomallei A79D]KGY06018.1 hypothetical protein X997_6109 [Burkholderia pseudomallei A79C]
MRVTRHASHTACTAGMPLHAAQGAAPYAARSRIGIGIRERRTAGERRPDERMEIAQRGAYRSPAHSA